MKRIILIILLFITNTCAAEYPAEVGDWALLDRHKIDSTYIHLNKDAFIKDSTKGTKSMWFMEGFSKAGGSNKVLTEFGCKSRTIRDIYKVYYSESMGSGDLLFPDSDVKKPGPVIPGTLGEKLFNMICS